MARRIERASTAIESAFVKGGTRINLAHSGTPDYLRTRLPELQQLRIRIELDTDPPPMAEYEVLTLLTPIPFQVRLFELPCLFAGKLHAILCRDWKSRVKGRELDVTQLRRLLRQRFHEVDFDQAKRDVRPFIRDEPELELWDSAFFQSLVSKMEG